MSQFGAKRSGFIESYIEKDMGGEQSQLLAVCPLCKSNYTSARQCLPCGHCACNECLLHGTQEAILKSQFVVCPTCSTKHEPMQLRKALQQGCLEKDTPHCRKRNPNNPTLLAPPVIRLQLRAFFPKEFVSDESFVLDTNIPGGNEMKPTYGETGIPQNLDDILYDLIHALYQTEWVLLCTTGELLRTRSWIPCEI